MSEEHDANELVLSEENVLGEVTEREVAFELSIAEGERREGAVGTLWLMMKQHKENPPGYRHAWGKAWVSTKKGGKANHPVQKIRFRIEMPSPGGDVVSDNTKKNASSVKADCKYGGVVSGGFKCDWLAEATEPGYGTWRVKDRW